MNNRFYLPADQAELRVITRDDGGKAIGGYAAVYYRKGNPGTEFRLWDDLVERVREGAFDEALSRGDDVRGLFNHDGNLVLGRTSSGTLKLETNKRGLLYEIDLPATQYAQDLAVSIERGDVTGSSFAFRAEKVVWEEKTKDTPEIRWLEQVGLFDVSPVTYPAYEATTVAMRGLTDERDEWKAALEKERQAETRRKICQFSLARRKLAIALLSRR